MCTQTDYLYCFTAVGLKFQ